MYSVTSYSIRQTLLPQILVFSSGDTLVVPPVQSSYSNESQFLENAIAVTINREFSLHQAYPNPFNAGTVITYDLPARAYVRLAVFNVLGQEVARLVDEPQTVGRHTVTWEATSLASGVYFYQMRAGSFIDTKKLILIR